MGRNCNLVCACSFIGGDIVRRFEMAFRWQYKSEFAITRMSKKLFLQRTEELVNILSTSGSMKRAGEPRLRKEPGAAKIFVREIWSTKIIISLF